MSELAFIFVKVCKCPECGKEYERQCTHEEWGYRFNRENYCTYKCMRAAERRVLEKKKK